MTILQVKVQTSLKQDNNFFRESIVYPFVNFRINGGGFEISSKDFVDILRVFSF